MRLIKLNQSNRQAFKRLAQLVEPVRGQLGWVWPDESGRLGLGWGNNSQHQRIIDQLRQAFPHLSTSQVIHWLFDLVHFDLQTYLYRYSLIEDIKLNHDWLR